ncbi:MAG: tyrosine-type recombinase/integrase [Xenococcus sp. MO_188.B8]|nr:tyrosine-type recombinase/integrase [Xenococcus sp. MO_188.B8]
MYTFGQDKAKVGIVTVVKRRGSYKLRFNYPANSSHEIAIAKITPEGWQQAIRAAQLIDRDISLNDFDETYARYSIKHARKLQLAKEKKQKQYNLKEIWEQYKAQNKNRVAPTTIKHCWKEMDRYINLVPTSLLNPEKSQEFINYLLTKYRPSSLAGIFRASLYPAASQAVRQGILKRNVYREFKLPKIAKKKIECFDSDEIKAIIAAFYSDDYKPKRSAFPHSFYAPLVEFLALTGCRPEEAHAITWEDIKRQSDRVYVRFNKAYSNQIHLSHTKTHEIRLVAANERLIELLETMPLIENKNNLIFPSAKGGYISQGNWRTTYWKRVIDGLVEDKKVCKYLKPYALRHSAITSWIRQGFDPATVAAWAGTSTDMICKHYLAAKETHIIPPL